jgi:acyl carrier protein
MEQEIMERLKGIIVNDLDVNVKMTDIDEHASLFEDGLGLDSIAIVDLIVAIEKDFSISIEDEELSSGLFKNLTALTAFINNKQAA